MTTIESELCIPRTRRESGWFWLGPEPLPVLSQDQNSLNGKGWGKLPLKPVGGGSLNSKKRGDVSPEERWNHTHRKRGSGEGMSRSALGRPVIPKGFHSEQLMDCRSRAATITVL